MKSKIMRQRYELFKLEWMISHGYTLQDLIDELNCCEGFDTDKALHFIYNDWENNVGFGGSIWPCYQEWLECEGADLNAE